MPTYEDVDETFEYLDLSRRNMGVTGIQGTVMLLFPFVFISFLPFVLPSLCIFIFIFISLFLNRNIRRCSR